MYVMLLFKFNSWEEQDYNPKKVRENVCHTQKTMKQENVKVEII